MRNREILIAIGTAACLAARPSASFAEEPTPATKPWVLDYDDTECVAWREYGPADHPMTLLIRPSPDGATYDLDLVQKNAAGQFIEAYRGTVDFGKGPMRVTVLHYQNVADKLQIYQIRMSSVQMAQARSATSVTVERGNYQATVHLALQSMSNLLKGLDQCNADLRRYWNVGSKVAQPATGDVRTIFTDDDFPSPGGEGTAQFLLFIDESGKVAACHILRPSGVPTLDAMGCIVIKQRAKFTPAHDASGKAVRDAVVTPPVQWRIIGH